jgi:hypothetical protein
VVYYRRGSKNKNKNYMEKLQRRLRLFIVLALLTGAAAVLFVGTTHAQTTTVPAISIADLGLKATPPSGGLAGWWDSFTDGVRLQFTFSSEKKAELQLQRAAKLLAQLDNANGEARAQRLLEKYRAAINKVAADAKLNDTFLQRLLAQQGFLTQLQNANLFNLTEQLAVARNQNWEKLNTIIGDPSALSSRLAGLPAATPEAIARLASLLEEWRQRLTPEQQQQTSTAVDNLIEKLKNISPTQAATIAEQLRAFSTSQQVQMRLGALLEQVQPTLKGLVQQLAQPRQPNQDPTPSLTPDTGLGNVTVPPLTADEIATRRAELVDAVTKDELLALRQRWYGSAILYRQLSQYQHSLLDQLNAKLVKALGNGSQPQINTPVTDPDAGITPLPTQQLTPEQQAMGQAFINAQGINASDLPPPTVSY